MPGNDRRIALRQVLARDPDLLLLDEPFSELDAARCVEMRDLIGALAQRGKTVILTSRSLTHAKDVCDRFAVYDAGKIEAIGTLDEILATPDALRSIGPVLPPETAQRVLRIIREDLGQPGPPVEPSILQPLRESPMAADCAVIEQAAVAAKADEFLAPLVNGAWKPVSSEARQQIASPVNNQRLAALIKPVPAAAPHELKNRT
jgi:energy-coupling factor transporter ATP-binding protein EcfA2